MSSALKKLASFALVSVAVALVAPGCSQQAEGERCDKDKNGDADCESGLTCTPKESLNEKITDRCCPPAGTETDKRCTPGSANSGTAGSSNGGGAGKGGGSSSSEGGNDAGGAPSDSAGTAGQGGSATPSAGSASMSDAGQSVGGDAPTAAGGNGAGGTP